MGGVARIVSFILRGGRCSERYGMSGSEACHRSRAVFDVEVLSFSLPFAFFVYFLFFASLGRYEAPSISPLCISHSSSVHDIQLISECRLRISLGIGSVISSPHELPINILLSLLFVGEEAGTEAVALRFCDRVTAALVISVMRYSGLLR